MAKGYRHVTPDQERLILADYQRSQIVSVTAEATGASPDQVRRVLRRNGIELSRAQERGACWQHRDMIRAMAAEGATLTAMAEAVGCNRRHLKAFLERHQIDYAEYHKRGSQNPAWHGGRIVDKDGYVLVKAPDHPNRDRHGYMREHRLVMESVLGRLLEAGEVVHHRDGDKQNNDPENLEVFAANGEHLSMTLTGIRKNISPEGRERIRAAKRRYWQRRRESTRSA